WQQPAHPLPKNRNLLMSFFKGWDDSPRVPAVHHKAGLPVADKMMANDVRVGYGRDGDYLHVQSFNDLNLEKSLAPGAPITALRSGKARRCATLRSALPDVPADTPSNRGRGLPGRFSIPLRGLCDGDMGRFVSASWS